MIRRGMVRYIGCSNYAAWQLPGPRPSERAGLARYDCIQPRYNILFREIEAELLPLCRDQGVGVIVYNPLAGGLLTGKHARSAPTPGTRFTLGISGELSRALLARRAIRGRRDPERPLPRRGLNLATVSVAWVLEQPAHAAIVGAGRAEH